MKPPRSQVKQGKQANDSPPSSVSPVSRYTKNIRLLRYFPCPALLYAGFCLPRFDAGEATISLGQSLLKGSSGGVAGATEPSRTPATQFLLAPPRVYRLLAECPVGPFHFLSFGPRKPEMYVTGLVSVALVLTRVLGISRVGGRYPHGVPLVSGRSSRTAERYQRSPKEQDPHYPSFLAFLQASCRVLQLVEPRQINDDADASRFSSGPSRACRGVIKQRCSLSDHSLQPLPKPL